MGRPKKNPTLDEQIELVEKKIQKYTELLEAAKKELKDLLDQRDKDKEKNCWKQWFPASVHTKRSWSSSRAIRMATMSGDQAVSRKISGSSEIVVLLTGDF